MTLAPIGPIISDDETHRVRRLQQLQVLDTAAEEVFDRLVETAALVTGRPIALISLVDSDRVWIKAAVGFPQGTQIDRELTLCDLVICSNDYFEVEDARVDPRFAQGPLVLGKPYIAHYAAMPLTLPDGERVGTLCVIGHQPGLLDSVQRQVLQTLARQAVAILCLRANPRLERLAVLQHAASVIEFSPAGLMSVDAHGHVVYANERWLNLMDLPQTIDALGRGWLNAVTEAYRDTAAADWAAGIAAGRTFEMRFPVTVGSGERWIALRVRPTGAGTSAAAFVGACADVTDSMRNKDALLARKDLLEAVFNSLPHGLAVFDQDLRHIACNQQMRDHLDIPPDLMTGAPFHLSEVFRLGAMRGDHGPGDVEQLVARALHQARTVERSRDEQVRSNGRTLEIHGARMPNGWRVYLCTDVTEQRLGAKGLADSERRLALALQATGLGLWEYFPESDALFLGEGWGRRLGYPLEARTIKASQLEDLLPAGTLERHRGDLIALLKGDSPLMRIEHELINAQGQAVWMRTEGIVVERDAQGRAVRVVGTNKDITKGRLQNEALQAAVARADAANRAKAQFLATMSHEIRTPINGVIGLTRMLTETVLEAHPRKLVNMVSSCADTLLDLVNDVLDFSKIEAGQMELESIDTDLHALTGQIGDVFSARAKDKQIGFSAHIDPKVPQWIKTDSHRVRQILLNLLGNALKFTHSGGISLKVLPPLQATPDRLRLLVSDTGVGMSEEVQARLFQRYVQAEASTARHFQGTGLGLAISRELALLLGGDVSVSSTIGIGSTFTLEIPLIPANPEPSMPAALNDPRRACDAQVLLVEDNAINQLVAKSLLAKLGYTNVTLAEDGTRALDACKHQAFSLILMDCQMPLMDGYEATRTLRAQGHRMPIIALTASAVADDRDKCLAAGMTDFVAKPIDARTLDETLTRHLAALPTANEARVH